MQDQISKRKIERDGASHVDIGGKGMGLSIRLRVSQRMQLMCYLCVAFARLYRSGVGPTIKKKEVSLPAILRDLEHLRIHRAWLQLQHLHDQMIAAVVGVVHFQRHALSGTGDHAPQQDDRDAAPVLPRADHILEERWGARVHPTGAARGGYFVEALFASAAQQHPCADQYRIRVGRGEGGVEVAFEFGVAWVDGAVRAQVYIVSVAAWRSKK